MHGHRILVLGLVDRKRRLLIPVFWEILHRDLSEQTEGAEPNPAHEKHWQVALRLLQEAHQCGFPNVAIAADSGFACEDLFEALNERDISFVMEIKCNRKVARHGHRILNESVTDFFESRERHIVRHHGKVKFAAEATVLLKDAADTIKVVAVANHRQLDEKPFAYYVTNQSAWNASRVWDLARDRWSIEVQFRELKQLFTLGEAAVRSQQAVETTISVSAIALTVIRLEQLAEAERNKNQHRWPQPAGSIVRDLQLKALHDGISKLATPHESELREQFNHRLSHSNLKSKPICRPRNSSITSQLHPKQQARAHQPVGVNSKHQTLTGKRAEVDRNDQSQVRQCTQKEKAS